MNDKIKGIVLRIQDYKDNDLMLQVLTEDKGILSLIAKSAKKFTSKQHFFEGCLYEYIIDYKDNKTIYGIHGSKLLNSYTELDNTKLFSFKNILSEMTIKSKELIEYDTFNNFDFVLKNINDTNKYLLGSLFVSYMCRLHGVIPNVDECVTCKSKKVVAISSRAGGFLCLDHLNGEAIQDVNTLKRFRLISKASFKDYELIKDNEYSFNDFKLITDFFMDNASLNLKSYDFYKKVM
ncbi:MAG: DNA repair protein RecO [Erysipelotrichaceae bacterium]|nr:DNA repair protein RecO [Erysipelotrichaceae bacterium]